MDRHAPLSVVIGGLELSSSPCAASLVHRSLPARSYYRTATTRTFTSVAPATVRYRGQRPRYVATSSSA